MYDASDFDDAPLIGEGAAPVKPFRLAVTHAVKGPRVEGFRAYAEADAGSLLAMQRARTQMEQAQASAGLIFAAVVDDDGLSADYEPPTAEELDAAEERAAAIGAELADIGNRDDEDGDPDLVRDLVRDLQAEIDGLPSVDPRLEDPSQWSSKRRFEHIMNDPMERVRPDALTKLAELIISGAAAGRPTPKSESSSRGPRRTGRG